MTHFFRYVLALAGLMLLAAGTGRAQTVGYGDWQLHLPTDRPLRLADAGDRVYVATENAFYFFDKKLNTTQVLSRRDGLNGVKVSALAYDSLTQQTVLVYSDANIDILQANGTVRNLSDVLRKSVQGSKQINQVSIGAGKAYVSTSFGLVAVDLAKREISDTYANIGPGGAVVDVYDAAVANGALYAATSAGLLRGALSQNLLDYRNWALYQPVPPGTPQLRYRFLAVDAGQVYAAVNSVGNANSIYKYVPAATPAAATWQPVAGADAGLYRSLRGSSVGLLVVDDQAGVRRLDRTGAVTTVVPPAAGSSFIEDAVRSRDGNYYVANYALGLQRVAPGAGKASEFFVANGPESGRAFSLLADARSNKVNVFTGGYSQVYFPSGERSGFYEYSGGQWTNYTPLAFPSAADFPNPLSPVRGTRTPDGTLYVANFGGGLLEWKGKGQFRLFGENRPAGTPLLGTFGPNPNRVEITDVAATPEGKVWVVNRHVQGNSRSGLFLFDPATTTWQVIPYALGFEVLDRIALDDNGYVWVTVSRKTSGSVLGGDAIGLYAVDPALTSPNPPRLFNLSSGLPDNQVYELAKDRRGYIWAATIKGVAYFREPEGPFATAVGFVQPDVLRGEGTGYKALYSEAVRTLAVDGADRKWFGTDRGLWLFSPDADEALLHFTTANSPLPSDRIVDVKVNDKTGEVWVATEAGVVTFRGTATVTEGPVHCTAVFPNPVRPDFAGTLGISGLANNAVVKITDVAGHLVYATKAAGGTVTWNLTNPDGQRVRSGVYLVLSTDADGKNGCVSKVAVLSK